MFGNGDPLFWLIVCAAVVITIGAVFLSRWLEKRKREALRLLANQLGLTYRPDRSSSLGEKYTFLNKIGAQGSNRYASHILQGMFQEQEVLVFEYHYETYSTDSKGNRTTNHHYLSAYLLALPRQYPEMTIFPEGIFSKIAQAVGYDDIDFESAEFSRRYCVRSEDKRFAYDVCHPLAIQFLLDNQGMNVEIENSTLATVEDGEIVPQHVGPALNRLIEFRRLLPPHLLEN